MNNKHSVNTSDWDIQSSVKEIVLPVKLVWTKNFIFRTPDKNKKRFTFIPLHSLDIHQYGKNKEDITSQRNPINSNHFSGDLGVLNVSRCGVILTPAMFLGVDLKDKNKEIFIIFRPMSVNAKKEDYEIIKTSTAVFQVLDWLPINHFKQYANTVHLLKEYISFGNSFIELEN